MSEKLWTSMFTVSEDLLLDRTRPNKTLVEEALSFDAALLHSISDEDLRKYLIVLGQYLISLQFEENKAEAVCSAWQKALDSHIYLVMRELPEGSKKITLAEKRALVLEKDEQARQLDIEYQVSDSKRMIIKNMHKPLEQYINTLKKEVDARENEKRRCG